LSEPGATNTPVTDESFRFDTASMKLPLPSSMIVRAVLDAITRLLKIR
jgi:hypothetical protein